MIWIMGLRKYGYVAEQPGSAKTATTAMQR